MPFINQQGEWTVYLAQPERAVSFTEPTRVSIYSYRTTESFAATFLSDQAGHAPPDRRIKLHDNRYYAPTEEGVFLNFPCWLSISATLTDMIARGTLRQHFQLAPPPLALWSTLPLREIPLPAAAEEFRAALANLYTNGTVLMTLYEAPNRAELETCLDLRRAVAPLFQTELMRNPVLATHPVPEASCPEAMADANWVGIGAFRLAADFASALYTGGACQGLHGGHERALALGQAARESLWGSNYDAIYAWSCYDPWSGWFTDVRWDWTLIALDLKTSRITCLFATDAD